jgi:VWFA-related protein
MRVRGFPLLLIFLACLSLARGQDSQPPAPPPPPGQSSATIRRDVNLVDVLFTVSNRQNRPVVDMNQDDFKIFDDNARQEIRSFSRQTDLPLRVGLLIDTSNSIRDRFDFEKQAAIDFLFSVVRRDRDQAFLMTVDDDPEVIQGLTGDVDLLRDAIQRQRAGGATALYDAIYQASAQLAKLAPESNSAALDLRRVLIVISDGEDNLSRRSRSEALEMAQRAGVVIYTVSTNTHGMLPDEETNAATAANRKLQKDPNDKVLDQFADESGGQSFFPYHAEDLALSFREISDELRSQYSLAYVPAGRAPDGKFHTIKIEVNEKGLLVHARRGYYAALPQPIASGGPGS